MIPTLGGADTLPRVLAGLAAQTLPRRQFEVLLALDNAADAEATAGIETMLARSGLPGRVVRGARPGASANRNAGARAASAGLVLFCDDDTIPTAPMLAEHLAWHRHHPQPEVSVLGLVRWAPEVEVTAFMKWLDRGTQFDFPFIRGIDAGWGRYFSANVSSKREFVLETVGGFDEVNFPYGYEDLDFGYRANEHGLRLLFNRAAVADHLRTMTLEFWRRRIRRVAVSERRFTEIHPDCEPWFLRIFEQVSGLPPASGRGRHLARWVPPGLPWLGPRVWNSTDLYFKQALAPEFLEAWADAGEGTDSPIGPDLSERTS